MVPAVVCNVGYAEHLAAMGMMDSENSDGSSRVPVILVLCVMQQYSRSALRREGQFGYLASLSAKDAIAHAREQSRKPQRANKPGKAAPKRVLGIPVEAPEIGETATYVLSSHVLFALICGSGELSACGPADKSILLGGASVRPRLEARAYTLLF